MAPLLTLTAFILGLQPTSPRPIAHSLRQLSVQLFPLGEYASSELRMLAETTCTVLGHRANMGHAIEQFVITECVAERASGDLLSATQHLQLARCNCRDHDAHQHSNSGPHDDILPD